MIETQSFFQSDAFLAAAVQAGAGLLQAIAIIVAAFLAYHFALRQMRRQTGIQVEENLRQRQADALQAAWSLLQSLTQVDNEYSIIRVVRHESDAEGMIADVEHGATPLSPQALSDGSRSPKRCYYIHLPNAHSFVFERLPSAFYGRGAGLLWSTVVRDRFFEARSIIYGVLLAEGVLHLHTSADSRERAPGHAPATAELRPLNRAELAIKLHGICDELNFLLKQEVQAVYRHTS
jgi:hypothetical protein